MPRKTKISENAELVFQDLPIRVNQSGISSVILKSVFVNSYVCSYGHCQQGYAEVHQMNWKQRVGRPNLNLKYF